MRDYLKFYIGGEWVDPAQPALIAVENPATEEIVGHVAAGSAADVDRAVKAARAAFPGWSRTTREERLDVLKRIADGCKARFDDLATAITTEMGAPAMLAQRAQVPAAVTHLKTTIAALEHLEFEQERGGTRVVKEAIGVCGLITPWNWPLNQIVAKVAPALAAGCTMVLKPSEISPFSAQIFAEIIDAAGVPAGVFNLVQGDGPSVGAALSSHVDVDMISFTGSTRGGVDVARNAAPTVKRVAQELGGKSPNIILDDATLAKGVRRGVVSMMNNSGQSCAAPSRMLVPRSRLEEAVAIAAETASGMTVGDPTGDSQLGPLVSRAQYDRVQKYIGIGLSEGADLVAGGLGRPDGIDKGHFARPTIFSGVSNNMEIAREEIFGPVLCIIPYDTIDDAIAIANDTIYGLAAFVHGGDQEQARAVARQLRAGQVTINGGGDMSAPFGGYKMSGNGREWGDYALHEYLETKAIIGFEPPAR